MRHWISRYLSLKADDLLIDAGCGTGTFLAEMSKTCRVMGLDDHDESIDIARPRLEALGGEVVQTTLDNVPLEDGCASVVTALDVLEHLDDDHAAVNELTRLLKRGGLFVATVPALRMLWSDWDVALHHRRRYHRWEFRKLFDIPALETLRCQYFNSIAFVPVVMVRMWRKVCPPRPGADRAEDRIPSNWLNGILYHTMVTPACWSWYQPPLGVSLLMVARKR